MPRRPRRPPQARDPLSLIASRVLSDRHDDYDWDPLPLRSDLPLTVFPAVRSIPSDIEDRREFYPDDPPVRSARRRVVPAKAVSPPRATPFQSPFFTGGVLVFKAPRYAAVCIRRKRRREVIFAKGRAGGGKRRGRRNALSNVRC